MLLFSPIVKAYLSLENPNEQMKESILQCLQLCRVMKIPSEYDLKETGIGKLINKVSKLECVSSDELKSKTIAFGKEIVDLWKNACK